MGRHNFGYCISNLCIKIETMISVETINPVYSSAEGKVKSGGKKAKVSTTELTKREMRVSQRKAKRNAPKLKRIRRKNGRNAFVMRLIKLVPIQKTQKFSGGDSTITAIASPVTEYEKKFADGTTIKIPATDVIVNTAGVFDKNDIARAFGVTKEALTQQMIDNYLVYIVPAPANSDTATETNKSASSDVAIEVPEDKLVTTDEGTFLATDTQGKDETPKDVAEEQKAEQQPLKKYEKVILWGGIALVVIIAGVIIYRKMNKGGSKGK
jgi:hypothetical protein